jgi:hypothetical protein
VGSEAEPSLATGAASDETTASHELAARLRDCAAEIEDRLVVSIDGLYELPPDEQTEIVSGAQAVARDLVAYTIEIIESGPAKAGEPLGPPLPLPESPLAQARYAARIGMPLEDLLGGINAGSTVVSEFFARESQLLTRAYDMLAGIAIQSQVNGALIEGLTTEYRREAERLDSSPVLVRARRVERFLAEDSATDLDLDYGLDAWHVAGLATGADAANACRLLAEALGCALLLVPRAAEVQWAWWGGPRRIPFADLGAAAAELTGSFALTVGEPRPGAAGFRDSHREAQLAGAVLARTRARLLRAADALLPALLLRDPDVADLYLSAQLGRLREHREWPSLRETLRSYLRASGNTASAAAALGVDRHTVRRRLDKLERLSERPLRLSQDQLGLALELEDLLAASLAKGT